MANKQFNVRQIQKHDTEANWDLTDGFIPFDGELIVYDKDATHDKPRIKIGDGVTDVKNLPFSGGGYDKPAEGIPYSDLDSELQADINRARNNPMVISLTLDAEYDGEGKKYTYTENYSDIVNNRDHIIFKIGTTLIKPSTAILDEVLVFSGLITKDTKYQMVVITVPNTAEKYVLVYDDETILTNKTFEIINYSNDAGDGWKCDHTFEEIYELVSSNVICIAEIHELDIGDFSGLLCRRFITLKDTKFIVDGYCIDEGWSLGIPIRGVLTHTKSSITFEIYNNIDIDVIYSRTDGGQISCNVPYSGIISTLKNSASITFDLFKQTNYSKCHINGIFIDIDSSNKTANFIQLGSPHLEDNGTILYTQFIYRGEDVGGNQVITLYHDSGDNIGYRDDIRLANIHHIDSSISGFPGRVLMHDSDVSDTDPTWEPIMRQVDISKTPLDIVIDYLLSAMERAYQSPESLVRLAVPVDGVDLELLRSIMLSISAGRPISISTFDISGSLEGDAGIANLIIDNVNIINNGNDAEVILGGHLSFAANDISVESTLKILILLGDGISCKVLITAIAHQTKQVTSLKGEPLVMPMVPAPVTGTLQLPAASWQDNNDGTYYQNITITGSTQYSKIDLQPDATVLAQLSSDGVGALYVQNLNNVLKAVAVGNMPSEDLSVMYVMSAVYDGAVTPGGGDDFYVANHIDDGTSDIIIDTTYSELQEAISANKRILIEISPNGSNTVTAQLFLLNFSIESFPSFLAVSNTVPNLDGGFDVLLLRRQNNSSDTLACEFGSISSSSSGVTSVNGMTGDVTISGSDIGGVVTSVNGQSGDINITCVSDISLTSGTLEDNPNGITKLIYQDLDGNTSEAGNISTTSLHYLSIPAAGEDWTDNEDGTFSCEIADISISPCYKVDLQPEAEILSLLVESEITGMYAVTTDDQPSKIRIVSIGAMPLRSFTIQATFTEVV